VIDEIARRSARLIVMTETGADFLRNIYGIPGDKVDVFPHGIPDVPFVDPNFYKDQFGVEGRPVLLTFGLLSPNKGTGRWTEDAEMLETGLKSLRWLAKNQTAESGHFRPVGTSGFWRREGRPARFDQQPLEANAMLSACLEAHGATGDEFWLQETRRSFDWFLGSNDLGTALFDAQTGGCRDGLHIDRANPNQGAESTLAFLLSLSELRLAQNGFVAARPGRPYERPAHAS
jgi:hypothetical protein